MKVICIAILTLFICNGCCTALCIGLVGAYGSEENLTANTHNMRGGLSEDGESIVIKSNENDYLIEQTEDEEYSISRRSGLIIDKPLMISGYERTPKNKNEYIHLKKKDSDHLYLEVKTQDTEAVEVKVERHTNTDPVYLKRTGLVLLTPVALTADALLVVGYVVEKVVRAALR